MMQLLYFMLKMKDTFPVKDRSNCGTVPHLGEMNSIFYLLIFICVAVQVVGVTGCRHTAT